MAKNIFILYFNFVLQRFLNYTVARSIHIFLHSLFWIWWDSYNWFVHIFNGFRPLKSSIVPLTIFCPMKDFFTFGIATVVRRRKFMPYGPKDCSRLVLIFLGRIENHWKFHWSFYSYLFRHMYILFLCLTNLICLDSLLLSRPINISTFLSTSIFMVNRLFF